MKNTKTLLICLTILISAQCWWDGGHMLTAEIAKQEILLKSPSLFPMIEYYSTILNPLSNAKSQTFVQAASWPDDIKDDPFNFLDLVHFYDKPWNPDGLYLNMD